MKYLLLIFAVLPLSLAAQSWSGIVNTSRAIDWGKAGLPATLPDGETTANPWTPPTRPACTSAQAGITVPVAAGTSFSTIVSAMAACAAANPTGSYLLLGSGSFTLPSTTVLGVSNISLRGSGPMSTTLSFSGGSVLFYGSSGSYGGGLLNASPGAGSSSVTITGAGGVAPVVGYQGWLNQCDTGFSGSTNPTLGYNTCATGSVSDNGAIFVCGGNIACNTNGSGSGAGGQTSQFQYFRVTSVTNNGGGSYTLGFTPGLYLPNWSTSNTAAMYWRNGGVTGLGIEDMTIKVAGGSVQMSNSYASWFKGIRFIGNSGNFVLQLGPQTNNSLISNNYLFGANPSSMTANGIQIVPLEESDDLILNNASEQALFLEGHGSSSGTVIAYNYSKNVSTNYVQATDYQHDNANSGVSFVLNEGNQVNEIIDDNTWGTGDLNTFFRNWVSCSEEPYVYSSGNGIGIGISSFHRFDNAIANVLAGGNECTGYSGTAFHNWFWINGPGTDTLTATSLMRWANYDAFNAAVRCQSSEVPTVLSGNAIPFENSVPATPTVCGGAATIPASFFMNSATAHPSGGTGLSWWKVCTSGFNASTGACAGSSTTEPFPSTGPDVSGGSFASGFAYPNPAQLAWQTLPIDTSLQNSYTITGSSWAGGVETLTISGLPTGTQIMGPFQISGGACATGSAEVTMTGSTGTTVSYARASNPGSCTGTMLWPDVRQFNEAVFQSDPAGTSFTWTPAVVGSGTITGTNSTSGSYVSGTTIGPLTANPASGFSFTGWSGDTGDALCVGTTNPCPSFSLTADSGVTANFAAIPSTCGDPSQLSPHFSGSYVVPPTTLPLTVGFTSPTSGCLMHYTSDGSSPTCASTSYPGGNLSISALGTYTFRVIACQSGWTSSNVIGGTWAVTSGSTGHTEFYISANASSDIPNPFPAINRSIASEWSDLLTTPATDCNTYNWTPLDNWISASSAHGAVNLYTFSHIPQCANGTTNIGNPPTDIGTGNTFFANFVTAFMKHICGVSFPPASPLPYTSCSNMQYIELWNEANVGKYWTGTDAQMATMFNTAIPIIRTYCSTCSIIGGSWSAGGKGNEFYYTAALAVFQNLTSFPDLVSFHPYPSRTNVEPVPFPDTVVSNSSATCTALNTPNVSCDVAVGSEVTYFQTHVLNDASIPWAANLGVVLTEGGYGINDGVCDGTDCDWSHANVQILRGSYTAQWMLALWDQQVQWTMWYSDKDQCWGTLTGTGGSPGSSCPNTPAFTGSTASHQAFVQMNTWLNSASFNGHKTCTSVTGGSVCKIPLTISGSNAEIDYYTGWLTTSTQTTTFGTQQNLAGVISSTGGSVVLSQQPILLTNTVTPPVTNLSGVAMAGVVIQ